ncbi:hypothetical protein DERP_008437 [Dermatophagoides pteronyssinus]|uniref:Uncharacterized protein n=1 Tax=Dermatophagoides pteronyssinus TaxID=6956 RepID=A0ABQ8IVG4_DERPT|nr:hypothetical protein DERP_008437 [Dermatophagoides pteronyssinus]
MTLDRYYDWNNVVVAAVLPSSNNLLEIFYDPYLDDDEGVGIREPPPPEPEETNEQIEVDLVLCAGVNNDDDNDDLFVVAEWYKINNRFLVEVDRSPKTLTYQV